MSQIIKPKKKKENLKQRAYLNSVTSVLDYGARIVTNFFVTPFLISGLGSTLFGAWKVLGQFTSYTNLADIKATQVLKWAVAKDRDSISEEELREYVTATFFLVMMILPLLFVAGAVISWYSPQITNVPAEYYTTVRIASAILVLALVTNKVFDIFESILRGMNLGFKRMGFRATVFVIGGVLQAAVVLMGYGLVGLTLVQVLINLVIGVTIYVIVKRNVPWLGWGRINLKKSFSFLKSSGWFTVWALVNSVIVNSDKVLLGYLMGPAIVTQYVITEYLIRATRGVIGNTINGVIPGIGKLYGNSDYLKLNTARNHIMSLTWVMGTSIGAVVILFNRSFIELWIGNSEYAGHIANILIVLTSIQYMFIRNDSAIISTTLNIKNIVYIGLVSAVVSTSLVFILIPNYGIAGLCVSLIVGRLVMSIGYPIIISNKINFSIQIKEFIRPGIVLLVIWFISYFLSTKLLLSNWLSLIPSVIFYLGIVIVVSFITGLSEQIRKELLTYKNKLKFFETE